MVDKEGVHAFTVQLPFSMYRKLKDVGYRTEKTLRDLIVEGVEYVLEQNTAIKNQES